MNTLAGAVGRRVCVKPKELDPWLVVPNRWGGIVAEPGQMKSPVLGAVIAPLKAIEREWLQEHTAALREHKQREADAKREKDVWEQRERARLSGNNKPVPPRPAEPPDAPPQRRLMTQDASMQKLHEMLVANPAGIYVFRDELAGWFSQLEKPGREQERQFYIEGWNGDVSYTIDTIGRGSVYVPNVCISLFGSIQPARLRFYLAEALRGGPANDGLMQRLQLLVMPDPLKALRVYVDRLADAEAAGRLEMIFRRLVALDPQTPLVFHFDAEAQELFVEWLPKLENRCQPSGGEGEAIRAHLAKYRSLMPTLALLFALAELLARRESIAEAERVVTLAHARRAVAWCVYLESHARRIYSAEASPEQAAAFALG